MGLTHLSFYLQREEEKVNRKVGLYDQNIEQIDQAI